MVLIIKVLIFVNAPAKCVLIVAISNKTTISKQNIATYIICRVRRVLNNIQNYQNNVEI